MGNINEIFISYSSKDAAIADAVCQYLEKHGINCWIAPRNVRAGSDYGAEIVDSIEASKVSSEKTEHRNY